MLLNDINIRDCCLLPDGTPCNSPMIEPFSEGVQDGGVISYGLSHAGYDLRLGDTLLVFKNTCNEVVDPKRFNDPDYCSRVFDEVKARADYRQGCCVFVLPPHGYALGYSLEYLRIPAMIKGRCEGKSTLARSGLLINTTPLEPGWHGHLTIEISNITPCPALVYAGEGIAQLEFETLMGLPGITYADKRGKYQEQQAVPVPARMFATA